MALNSRSADAKTLVDQIAIKIDGQDVRDEYLDGLAEVEVNTTVGLPSMFIMRLFDKEVKLIDTNVFPLGKSVQIDIRKRGTTSFTTVFKGEITAVEPHFNENFDATLVVRGYDKGHRLTRGTNTKVFINVKDSDIVSQIVGPAGLSASVTQTKAVYDHVFQDNQNDLAFIQSLARRNGYEIAVDDTTLYFRPPQASTTVNMEWGDELKSFHPQMTIANQVTQVTVKGWDPKDKKEIIGQATSSKTQPQIGVGQWGGQATSSAISQSPIYVTVQETVYSQTEADNIAKAILDEINGGFIEAEGTAFGNPDIKAGVKVNLSSLGTRFSGTYLVTSATHLYTRDSYETNFTVEGMRHKLISDLLDDVPAGGARAGTPTWGGVVTGIVTNNDDSQANGSLGARVKVKFPWLDASLESAWARVSGPSAGDQRGMFWMPEVDDEVLVAFENGDFNRPYVIGALWNGKDKPPEQQPVTDGKVNMRTFKSRSGHIFRMNDKQGEEKIEIIDKDGKHAITIDSQNKKVIIDNGDGDIEINGGAKFVLKATGDIELEGNNVKITAQANFEATANAAVNIKGNSPSTVESSAILALKGSLVNIN